MDGLIPLVYKRIKRSVSHRHYKCLSTTSDADHDHNGLRRSPPLPETHGRVSDPSFQRRSSSLPRIRHAHAEAKDSTAGFGHNYYLDQDPTRGRPMDRFRSHRRMFSCITG